MDVWVIIYIDNIYKTMFNPQFIYDSCAKIPNDVNGTNVKDLLLSGDDTVFPYNMRILTAPITVSNGPKLYLVAFSGKRWSLSATDYLLFGARLHNIQMDDDSYARTNSELVRSGISNVFMATLLINSGRYPNFGEAEYAMYTGKNVDPKLYDEWYTTQPIYILNHSSQEVTVNNVPPIGYMCGPTSLIDATYTISLAGQKHPRSTDIEPVYQRGLKVTVNNLNHASTVANTQREYSEDKSNESEEVLPAFNQTPSELRAKMYKARRSSQGSFLKRLLPQAAGNGVRSVYINGSNPLARILGTGSLIVSIAIASIFLNSVLKEKNAATRTDDEPTPTTIIADQPEATPGTKGETWMDRGIDAVKGGIDTVTGAVSDAAQTVTGEEKPSQPIDICRTDVSDGLAPRREPIIDPSTKLPFVGTLYNTKIPVRAYVKDGSGNTFAEVYVRDLVGAEVAKRQGFKPEDKVYIAARLADGSVYCVSTGEISRLNSTIASLTNEYKNQKLSRGV